VPETLHNDRADLGFREIHLTGMGCIKPGGTGNGSHSAICRDIIGS
jgi:hypothetical protein